MKGLIASALCLGAAASQANPMTVGIDPCSDIKGPMIDMIAEPWEDHSALFYDGKVRMAVISQHLSEALAIISPPYDDGGRAQCKILGRNLPISRLDFANHVADYNTEDGLIVSMPFLQYHDTDDLGIIEIPDGNLVVILNPTTGALTYRTDQ
ncbi:MAG: hypothetical protein AAF386_05180 [Pseudomonadota bacterium]